MEDLVNRLIPDATQSKLRDLFNELDKDRDGYLSHAEMKLLGYVVSGKLPTHDDVVFEISRARRECQQLLRDEGVVEISRLGETEEASAERLPLHEFLLFSRHLAQVDPSQAVKVIDSLVQKVRNANTVISPEYLQRAHLLHINKSTYFR